MLKITNELIEYFKFSANTDPSIVHAYINSILKIGSKKDADILLEYYLNATLDEYDSSYLFKIFEKYGNLYYAEQIFNKVIHNQKLIDESESEVLLTLSILNYLPIKPILFEYIKIDQYDFDLMKYSILGLLNFDCSDYTDEIQIILDKYLSKVSYQEFIPALVCKIPNYVNYLEKFYNYAENVNTSDMNSGIIIGFSLCGEEGKKYFLKSLFNPNFDAYCNSSGTSFFVYQGMKNLNIQFSDIYNIIKQNNDTEFINYSIDVLFSLLKKRIYDYEENLVTFRELYNIFFVWETNTISNNLIDLARKVEKEEEAYRLERLIVLKMEEEILISNLK